MSLISLGKYSEMQIMEQAILSANHADERFQQNIDQNSQLLHTRTYIVRSVNKVRNHNIIKYNLPATQSDYLNERGVHDMHINFYSFF